MVRLTFICLLFIIISCKKSVSGSEARKPISQSETVVDSSRVKVNYFREFKVLDSRVIDKTQIWEALNPQLSDFTLSDYDRLKPLILEADIPTLQQYVADGKFTYEQLTKFYLYRIRALDRDNALSLNAVISINPNVINDAKALDQDSTAKQHPIYGMPLLLKDNINTSNMATTAGAVALLQNKTDDAYIVKQLKSKGALILGKANLSEWAYFFCGDCPSGYSAVGGQTLNPYGRGTIDTGGSSSGSGVAVAANFCVAAIGTETSGSILSPSSSNSIVGLKPTVGLVSRTGIIPISSTLDTAGPMAKTVFDAAIVLDAIFGEDVQDSKSFMMLWDSGFYTKRLKNATVRGKRFGVPKELLKDTLFYEAIEVLKAKGAAIQPLEMGDVDLPHFVRLLNLDMKKDLPKYLESYTNTPLALKTVADIMEFNRKDSLSRIPYGQSVFQGIVEDKGDNDFLKRIQDTLRSNGQRFFDSPMQAYRLDGILSMNNKHAAYAAVAAYPAITVPMGYEATGKPSGLTFISGRLREKQLLEWAYVYEQASKVRVAPKAYQ